MANRIQVSDDDDEDEEKAKKAVPDPFDDPLLVRPRRAEDVAPAPAIDPHAADYDDEVPSQRRLRWMTQALVVPCFVGGVWLLGLILSYGVGLFRCDGAAGTLRPYAGCVVGLALTAPMAWYVARGKIGMRRWWLNAIVVVVMFSLGARTGWRASGDPSSCEELSR